MYKNIEKQAVLQLKDLVEYQTGQVVSKTLVQNDKVSMTIFSFDKGEEISDRKSTRLNSSHSRKSRMPSSA